MVYFSSAEASVVVTEAGLKAETGPETTSLRVQSHVRILLRLLSVLNWVGSAFLISCCHVVLHLWRSHLDILYSW